MQVPARLHDEVVIATRPRGWTAAVLTACFAAGLAGGSVLARAQRAAAPAGAAVLVLDWSGAGQGREARPEVLDTPVLPGSIAKVFALAAAAEAGLVDERTTHVCRRVAVADGRRFACSHPDLKRPLTAAEALAYSCNDFFAELASRLPRATLNEVRRRAGLTAIPDAAPWTSAVLGLAGPPVAPRALVAAVAKVVGAGPSPIALKPATRRLLRDGMRGAADYGSAGALSQHGVAALAKTGTSPMPGGRALGLVVAFAPPDAPATAALVVTPGGAGLDAASVAADLLAGAPAQSRPAAAAPVGVPAASPVDDDRLRLASRGDTIRIGRTQADGSVKVETLAIEDYVARVISGEGQPRAGAAAQEALAIVVRTFAAANRHRHRAEGYDLCDTTHCQVLRPSIEPARQAAYATAGQLLLDRGRPAFVYYSALCGGIPALASEVWPGATDYQPAIQADDACRDEPAWVSELRADQLELALRAAGLRGQRLRGLTVIERTTSQRAGRLLVDGFSPPDISAHELRMAVGRTAGWQYVRSTAFTVTRTSTGYRFRGVGYGHGVGLCVIGAGRRAARGESASQILRAYFGNLQVSGASLTAVTPAAPPPRRAEAPTIVVEPPVAAPPVPAPATPAMKPVPMPAADVGLGLALPASEERERAATTALIRTARTEIARAAGMPEPPSLQITIHPTIESFGRATGQPWWVAAATVGRDIDAIPLTLLRQRGILESTLRHEIAHAVVDGALKERPVWVREGAAMYFANPSAAVAAAGRVSCPQDAELLRPVSAGAQREALARADRCFRKKLAERGDWREVR